MNVVDLIRKYYPSEWSMEDVNRLLINGKITLDAFLNLFPVTEDDPMTEDKRTLFRNAKLNELRQDCNCNIVSGIDVKTSHSGDGTEHFSLDSYDQNNITNMFYSVLSGAEKYPYHADGKECAVYTKNDIVNIYAKAQEAIAYHTTYNNMLRMLVNRTEDAGELAAIRYGMELPDDLAKIMSENFNTALEQIAAVVAEWSVSS